MKALLPGCLTASAMLLAGCGGADGDQVDVYPVSGKVTIAGGPLAGASVMFAPQDDQPAAMGRTDSEGNYKLTTYDAEDGAAEGAYAVVITKFTPAATTGTVNADGHSPPSSGHSAAAAKPADSGSLVPELYGSSETTPFKETVKPEGENVFNFEIQ